MDRTDFGQVPMSLADCDLAGAFVQPMNIPGRQMVQYTVKAPLFSDRPRHKALAQCSRPETAQLIADALRLYAKTQGESNESK